jgi:hypothetical protein
MIRKSGAESISENIPFQIGPYSSGTNCLQMLKELSLSLSPVNQVILEKG